MAMIITMIVRILFSENRVDTRFRGFKITSLQNLQSGRAPISPFRIGTIHCLVISQFYIAAREMPASRDTMQTVPQTNKLTYCSSVECIQCPVLRTS